MKATYHFQVGNEIKTVTVEGSGSRFQVTVGDHVFQVKLNRAAEGRLDYELDGSSGWAYVAHSNSHSHIFRAGRSWVLARAQPADGRRKRPSTRTLPTPDALKATMPGLVLEVLVAEGDRVDRGQTLVLLEAMKMELRITAPHAGRVRQVYCQAGQVTERDQLLVELEEE